MRRARAPQQLRELVPIVLLFLLLRPARAVAVAMIPQRAIGLTIEQLRALAKQTGFADPDTAAAVAMAESGGYAAAVGDQGKSIGLWQIHTPSHPEFDATKLKDPNYNASAALQISSGGTNWSPWTQWRTGAFRQYMPNPSTA